MGRGEEGGIKMKVKDYLNKGYSIVHESKKHTTLEKKKKFSFGWFIFWLILTGVGAVIYIIVHFAKTAEKITVET